MEIVLLFLVFVFRLLIHLNLCAKSQTQSTFYSLAWVAFTTFVDKIFFLCRLSLHPCQMSVDNKAKSLLLVSLLHLPIYVHLVASATLF